jgi:hypothetical protein
MLGTPGYLAVSGVNKLFSADRPIISDHSFICSMLIAIVITKLAKIFASSGLGRDDARSCNKLAMTSNRAYADSLRGGGSVYEIPSEETYDLIEESSGVYVSRIKVPSSQTLRCPMCTCVSEAGSGARNYASMNRHMKIKHKAPVRNEYFCRFCDYKGTGHFPMNDCTKHVQSVHNTKNEVKEAVSMDKEFVCTFAECCRNFSTKAGLSNHSKIHLREKPSIPVNPQSTQKDRVLANPTSTTVRGLDRPVGYELALQGWDGWLFDTTITTISKKLIGSRAGVIFINPMYWSKFNRREGMQAEVWPQQSGDNWTKALCPVNVNENHWTLAVFDRPTRTCTYLDSFRAPAPATVIQELHTIWKQIHKIDEHALAIYNVPLLNCAKQADNYNCGVYVLMFIERTLANQSFEITHKDVLAYRQKLCTDMNTTATPEAAITTRPVTGPRTNSHSVDVFLDRLADWQARKGDWTDFETLCMEFTGEQSKVLVESTP